MISQRKGTEQLDIVSNGFAVSDGKNHRSMFSIFYKKNKNKKNESALGQTFYRSVAAALGMAGIEPAQD